MLRVYAACARWLMGVREQTRRRALRLALLAFAAASVGVGGGTSRAVSSTSYECGGPLPIYRDTSYSFAERAADLVSCMTLAQKVAQLHTNNAPAIPGLGVQQYTYWNEGLHGINRLGADTNPGSATGGVHATSFPSNLASTMTWDPRLIYNESTAISDEARGFLDKSLWETGQNNLGPSPNDYGSLTYWAPTVNMDRDPRWGRTDEAFGEDPHLASQMAGAYVDGDQGETISGAPLSKYLKVASTAKHFALNDVENDRTSGSSNTDDANIRDYYTAQFKSLFENAHVSGFMTSYNAINGTPSVADTYTTDELAQRTYGFEGYTTSDCGAVTTTYQNPPAGHDWAPPGWTTNNGGAGAVWTNTASGRQVSGAAGGEAYALRAGTGLNCTGGEATLANVQQAIGAGILSEGVIDTALVHMFTVRMQTGEFDPPSDVAWTKIRRSVIQSPAHQALARKVADNALVLLKNDDVPGAGAPLLPADPSKLSNVVVVGNLAGTTTLGGYSGVPALQVDAVQGITAAVKRANPNANVYFDTAGTSTTATRPAVLSAQTQAEIKQADLVIVFVGTDESIASEVRLPSGRLAPTPKLDRTTIGMPGNYGSLISQVDALGNPRTALVIQSDGAVGIGNVTGDFPAIVFSAYNGESQGTALADVLFGRMNPSGHLNFTWYRDDSQLPPIENYGLTPSQTGGLGRTYLYFTGKPAYPFGYGLSYTTFRYSGVRVTPGATTSDGTVQVDFDVTNTGAVPGATVAQLYVAPPREQGIELPTEQLEGFHKTEILAPGQSEHITLPVALSSLSHWDESQLRQVVYVGTYKFMVGADASDIAGSAPVAVQGTLTPMVQYVTVQPDKVMFKPGDTLDLTTKNPWIQNDTDSALEQPHATADNIVDAVNNDESFVNLSTAKVSYATSNPDVATVTPTGIMTAVGAGVATISATVNGVGGSTPIVVQRPMSLTAPSIVPAGTTFTATTNLPNTGSAPLTDVDVSLTAPAGWSAQATSQSSLPTVNGGQTALTTWRVTVPSGTSPGSSQLSAVATFKDANGAGEASAESTISLPYPSLSAAFGNPGISDDADPSAGNLDGGGFSYSAEALAAKSLDPGATVIHDGLTFTWPDAPAGSADDVVAGGQAIAVSGSGTILGILGTGDNGTVTGTTTISYSDGTTQSFDLALADWFAGDAASGGDILASVPYLNTATGKYNHEVSVYYAALPLQPGKQVQYLTLPDVSQQPIAGQPAMHVFAVSIGGGAGQRESDRPAGHVRPRRRQTAPLPLVTDHRARCLPAALTATDPIDARVQAAHVGSKPAALRRHVDEQPIDELHRLAGQQPNLDNPVIQLRRATMQRRCSCGHRRDDSADLRQQPMLAHSEPSGGAMPKLRAEVAAGGCTMDSPRDPRTPGSQAGIAVPVVQTLLRARSRISARN